MKLKAQNKKAKNMYLSDELLGVEKRISPTQVGGKHASGLKNLLPRDGASAKRSGWREIYHFTDENDRDLKINGIYEYKKNAIIHAGEYLYKGDTRVGSLANEKSCGFENNGLLYIACGGELYIYDGRELTNAYDSAYSYIPLTTKDISPIGCEATGKENEAPSLLTPKRKNSLIGDKSERKAYRLDGKIDVNKPIEIRTKLLTGLNSTQPNVAPYNAIYKYASRLTKSNIEGVLGVDSDIICDIFSGEGTEYNLGAVEEISVFLKMPIKIENAIFEARDGACVPRMSFHLGNETVYDTEEDGDGICDLTDTLYGQTIDAINFYGSDSAVLYSVDIQGRESYQGELEIIHRVDSIAYHQAIRPTIIKDTEGRELTLSNNITGSHSQGAVVWIEQGIDKEALLGFGFCNVSPDFIESNIEITYSVIDGERLICNIGDVCKTDTGSAILALCDSNYVYLSCDKVGFGYFPYSLKRKIGTDGKITAICSMSDFSIGVFKEDSAYYLNVEHRNGSADIAMKSHSIQGGSLSHFATKTVNSDTLSPKKDNIYGSCGASGRVRRGSNIALDLKNLPLENSVAIEHNGMYLLFVSGCVFVADTRYKIYENNRLDSSFEYEWWCLDGIPASYVAKINDIIYIGREDGRIVSFYDGYSDIYYEKIDTGSYLLDNNDAEQTVLYLNEGLGLHTYDRLLVSSAYSYIGDVISQELNEGKLRLLLSSDNFWSGDNTLRFYPGLSVYLKTKNDELVTATVEGVDLTGYSILLNLTESIDTYTGVLYKNEGTGYKLEQQGERFLLLDEFGDYARLCLTDNVSLVCERRLPVVCEYVTSAILSEIHTKKSLYGISVELLGDSRGICEISYETDKSYNERECMLDSVFDFDSLDFSGVAFNSSLQKSYSLRCFERDIDYLIIKIKHSEDKPFFLKGFLAIYNERSF